MVSHGGIGIVDCPPEVKARGGGPAAQNGMATVRRDGPSPWVATERAPAPARPTTGAAPRAGLEMASGGVVAIVDPDPGKPMREQAALRKAQALELSDWPELRPGPPKRPRAANRPAHAVEARSPQRPRTDDRPAQPRDAVEICLSHGSKVTEKPAQPRDAAEVCLSQGLKAAEKPAQPRGAAGASSGPRAAERPAQQTHAVEARASDLERDGLALCRDARELGPEREQPPPDPRRDERPAAASSLRPARPPAETADSRQATPRRQAGLRPRPVLHTPQEVKGQRSGQPMRERDPEIGYE